MILFTLRQIHFFREGSKIQPFLRTWALGIRLKMFQRSKLIPLKKIMIPADVLSRAFITCESFPIRFRQWRSPRGRSKRPGCRTDLTGGSPALARGGQRAG